MHDVMAGWEKQPVLLDTTRIRRIGVGQHGRKNDSIDAEAIAMAMDAGRVPIAHVLSPERRILRAKLSVRGELVEMRARQVSLLRGLARAAGVLIPTSSTDSFLQSCSGRRSTNRHARSWRRWWQLSPSPRSNWPRPTRGSPRWPRAIPSSGFAQQRLGWRSSLRRLSFRSRATTITSRRQERDSTNGYDQRGRSASNLR